MIQMYGDWAKAGVVLRKLSTKLQPFMKAKLDESGKLVLETIKGHINDQDLDWTPLADATIERKGNDLVYYETGTLKDGLSVRKIKSAKDNITIFIGASPWKRHKPSGLKLSDLVIYLEYGTEVVPPRPLIQPSFEEVKDKIMKDWKNDIIEFIQKG